MTTSSDVWVDIQTFDHTSNNNFWKFKHIVQQVSSLDDTQIILVYPEGPVSHSIAQRYWFWI